jgi:hypothetical protein
MDLMRSMHIWFYRLRLFAIIAGFVVVATLTGCAAETRKSQALSRLDRLESELKQDVATKADVLLLLGAPSGSGEAMLPMASHANEVWYYEASGASLSGLKLNILLIYFKGDTYDGFMWFSNDADVYFE